ncbi:MAG: carbamoyltransferase, partial [Chloroflexi bacterium]|nr:carbamoyltransferase [Chloroflexota bacterium]
PGAPAPAPLTSLYLGNEISDAEAEAALVERAKHLEWTRHEDIERVAAKLIADHKIVGRVAGRMEWGARALGNRSILAHPSDLGNVRRLNAAIKMRDYWMPFAPSLLYERRHDYTENPRNLDAPTMTQAFRSTPLAQRELIAALHPSDLTCRPQFVRADQNPGYHHLLSCFQELTGIGGVLNTSLNLHGEPIVCSADDALNTLLNSGLDHLTLGQYLVSKRDPE